MTQYRVALSDANHWDDHDGAFDYTLFYNNVVDYFEFPPGPCTRTEVSRLLDWWNTYVPFLPAHILSNPRSSNVFGTTPRWSLYEGRVDAGTSSVAVMRAARIARETEV